MGYINKKKFAEKIANCSAFNRQGFEFEGNLLQGVVLDLIEAEPTADVEEVKHGYWAHKLDCNGYSCYECSCCNTLHEYSTDYCPNCGAKMDGGKAE